MKTRQTRQYEMLQRVRDFGTTYRGLVSVVQPRARGVRGRGRVSDVLKMSASVSARADRKRAARTALHGLLMDVSQLARVFRARGRAIAAFEVPASKSGQTLLTAARQFARDAETLEAEFAGHEPVEAPQDRRESFVHLPAERVEGDSRR